MATQIPIAKIVPNPRQPRTVFSEASLAELAESIRENDLIQPIVVEDNGDGSYTLVGGERRWRACQLLGRETIQAEIRARSNHGGRELLVLGLVENIQREDMNPMDEGEAYQRLHEEFKMTWVEIGQAVGKHSAAVQSRAILTHLEPEIRELIRAGKFSGSPDVARALLAIKDPAVRLKLVEQAIKKEMTLKQIQASAAKLAAMFSTPLEASGKASPAMRLARKQTRQDFDDDTPPDNWDALKQAGKVPAWPLVARHVATTCQSCSLAPMASDVTCRDCPLVEFVKRIVQVKP